MKLILATKNRHKVDELSAILEGYDIELLSLFDLPEMADIVEDGGTFEENAVKKARETFRATGILSLADDSGLVVHALGGEPGIYSSRYAGKEKDYAANNRKILEKMKDVPDGKRGAEFVCVMALVGEDGFERVVEGRLAGTIIRGLRGDKGFGYDPIFFIEEKNCTLAELPMEEKNLLSHRARALHNMKDVLLDILKK